MNTASQIGCFVSSLALGCCGARTLRAVSTIVSALGWRPQERGHGKARVFAPQRSAQPVRSASVAISVT